MGQPLNNSPNSTKAPTRPSVSMPRRLFAMIALVVCVAIIAGIWWTGTRFFLVPSSSMEPTLNPGDYIIAVKAHDYRRGDIVVFRNPDDDGDHLVKRIIGLPGDTVRVLGGAVFLNGRYASEPYRHSPIDYDMDPYIVQEGEYFLMGDNSNVSIDSHNWGATSAEEANTEKIVKGTPRGIPAENVLGRVTRIYLPWERRGPVRRYPLQGDVEILASQSSVKPMYNEAV